MNDNPSRVKLCPESLRYVTTDYTDDTDEESDTGGPE